MVRGYLPASQSGRCLGLYRLSVAHVWPGLALLSAFGGRNPSDYLSDLPSEQVSLLTCASLHLGGDVPGARGCCINTLR